MTSGSSFGQEWSASFRRGSEAELRSWVDAALSWCDEGDRIAMEHFRRGVSVEQKPDRTFVTIADRGVEQHIRERIADAFPGHGVVGEEFGTEAGSGDTRWYVDPIDGTHNYIRGVPIFATLLAVERDGELQAAVISASALGERWYGWRGGGAWVTGALRPGGPHRIGVSKISLLEDAQVVFASATETEGSGHAPGFRRLLETAWRERGFGDFWGYTLVSEGAAEVMVEPDLSPWDAAAPFLLVEEAGGRVTDFAGNRSVANRTFLATNGILHDEVRSMLLAREETSR
ncbi:MAG TPA: inositol monophosphatase family protein [Candidatus Limnocylindria bacterium]|nr:inositol monophosphatase family protein [Candidatus Limnocylindria bacterium]